MSDALDDGAPPSASPTQMDRLLQALDSQAMEQAWAERYAEAGVTAAAKLALVVLIAKTTKSEEPKEG
jgi:hypothetical protein